MLWGLVFSVTVGGSVGTKYTFKTPFDYLIFVYGTDGWFERVSKLLLGRHPRMATLFATTIIQGLDFTRLSGNLERSRKAFIGMVVAVQCTTVYSQLSDVRRGKAFHDRGAPT